jgi:hypothetical protein
VRLAFNQHRHSNNNIGIERSLVWSCCFSSSSKPDLGKLNKKIAEKASLIHFYEEKNTFSISFFSINIQTFLHIL